MGAVRQGRRRLWPRVNYYRALMPDGRERIHPVDAIIDTSSGVLAAHRRARRAGEAVRVRQGSEAAFRRFIDAQLAVSIERQDVAFNVGVEMGMLAARAQVARAARDRGTSGELNALRLGVRALLMETSLPLRDRLGVLLETAYSIGTGPLSAEAVSRAAGRPRARPSPRRRKNARPAAGR
jgi:hypothetical protein